LNAALVFISLFSNQVDEEIIVVKMNGEILTRGPGWAGCHRQLWRFDPATLAKDY
jgi:hypothetical protein